MLLATQNWKPWDNMMKRLEMCRSQGFTRNLGAEKIDRCHGEESVESTGLDHSDCDFCSGTCCCYAKSSSYSGCMDVWCTGDGSDSDFKDFNSSAKTFRANFKDEHCTVVFDAALAQVWLRIIRSRAVEPRFTMGCGQCRGVKPESRGFRSQGAPSTGLRADSSHVGIMEQATGLTCRTFNRL